MSVFLVACHLVACHSGFQPLSDSRDRLDGGSGQGGGSESELTPSPDSSPGTFRKGVTLVCWSPGCFVEEEETSSSLDYLQSLGVEWLAIVPTWYQSSASSSDILSDDDRSPTDDDIRFVIGQARARGFKILLKPHIDVLTRAWRGNIQPTDLPAWRQNYREFILHYARLAQELNVEIFSIGTELRRRSGDLPFWIGLIEEIRPLFSGELTYSANWDEYELVSFWNLLDFIGIDFYFPLTNSSEATQAQMESGLGPIGERIRAFSQTRQRPILFTEIGYRSIDGANTRPHDFNRRGTIDLQEQADCYSAVLTLFENTDWLKGIFWWRADPRLIGGPSDDDYMFYNKPAADVLRGFWR